MGIQKHTRPTIVPDGGSGGYRDVGSEIDRTTAEVAAGYTDVNGDPVYQKTIVIAAGPNNETLNIAHGITGLKKLVRLEGYIDNGTFWRSVNNLEATATANLHWALSATNFVLVSGTGGDYSGYSGSVTVWYTKT